MKLVLALMALVCLSVPASAKHHAVAPICDNFDLMRPCAYNPNPFSGARSFTVKMTRDRHARVKHGHRREPAVAKQEIIVPEISFTPPEIAVSAPSNDRLDGVAPALATKIHQIIQTCGSEVISAVRHTYVAGTHIISQHANGTAVDIAHNPHCIYSMLQDWPGGYSVDYGRVHHVHISIGGREAGVRFVHGGHHHRHYAHHHGHHRILAHG